MASTDEVGRLAGSFNHVVEELDQTMTTLAGERDHLETILDSLSEGVLVLDTAQRLTRVNRAALGLLDLDSTAPGLPLLEAVRVPALVELASADSREPSATVEFDLPGSRHIRAQAAPLQTGGRVVVMHDITRSKKLEVIRRDFVANVSHELRTPVSVIRANAETLLDGAIHDQERARVFLDAVFRNADRLSHIIADLLDLSRLEAGEYGLDVGNIEMDTVLHRAISSLNELARAKDLAIELEVPLGTSVHADGNAVEQVIINLLHNAVKYSDKGGRAIIRAISNEALIRVEVEDDGPGIELRHRPRISERFYRVDPGRSREMGGTGLGLSIVRHLVETMGGEVGFEPRSPRGSIFWFTLPRSK